MQDDGDDALDAARRELYRLPPEQFLDARAELASGTDDARLGKAIAALRKPTQPAWIVNTYAAGNADLADTLADLGARLAKAQADLDTATMRELTLDRRRVVAETTKRALEAAGRPDANATLRDAVSATFDAAVADPEIAARLGALQKPQTWSGFGVVAPTALTVVGTSTPPTKPTAHETATMPLEPDTTAETAALDAAQHELDDAETAEQHLQANLRRLMTRLTTLQHQIADVRDRLGEAKQRTGQATRARRTAQAALDKRGAGAVVRGARGEQRDRRGGSGRTPGGTRG